MLSVEEVDSLSFFFTVCVPIEDVFPFCPSNLQGIVISRPSISHLCNAFSIYFCGESTRGKIYTVSSPLQILYRNV